MPKPKQPAFNPSRIFRVLLKHRVRFVVIGGIAGRLWGSTTVTNDLDVCYARDTENLRALAEALRELKAKLRGADRDLPFVYDARTLELGDQFTFITAAGNLDCLGTPPGTAGYETLIRTAAVMDLGKMQVAVAALEELLLMKRTSARRKDLIEAEILAAVRDEIARRG